ncbi:MAG: tripartite tricarboxylate transporter TctB family protein [Rhodospirillales bacterium]|nr:tripartite tricarboxylate transporter TctB family protein [Rhodospirillales bacterium]
MKVDQDIAAGVFFIALGAIGFALGWDYPFGTTARMGAGFVPKLLCGLLVTAGITIAGVGIIRRAEPMARWHLRPLLLVLASVLVFGGLIEWGGLVPATIGMVLVAAAASTDTRWLETTIVGIVLAGAAVLIFVKGLGLTMKILPGT